MRAVIGGHLIASGVGLAVGLAIAAMLATRTTHAPAGADSLLVMLAGEGWSFLLTPVAAVATLVVLAGCLHHRAKGRARYPKYWY